MVELFERALRASGKRFGVTAFARKAGSLFPVGARLVREWERVRRHHIRPQGGLLRRAGRTFARKSEDVCRHRIRPRGGLLRTLLERALRANWKRFGVTAFARKAGSYRVCLRTAVMRLTTIVSTNPTKNPGIISYSSNAPALNTSTQTTLVRKPPSMPAATPARVVPL
jgi:hypothetical protein